jgi:Ca2+-dependent lipid-binding protein
MDNWVVPHITLNLRVGKGRAPNALSVRVSGLSLSALFRIRLQLMPAFPYVQLVDFCFLDKPMFDFELLPIGGTTFGFDIERVGCCFNVVALIFN